MRFDDSLATVLASDPGGSAGVQAAWRQLVDLIGRRRGEDPVPAIARLRAIRDQVPLAVRAASARGLERADPPAELVALFADDAVEVAGPVVRAARLDADTWTALLPAMRPATRGVLRHRRDLAEPVQRALASFGPADFALPAGDLTEALVEAGPAAPDAPAFIAPDPDPFVPFGEVARDLPLIATAREEPEPQPAGDDFAIASLVARIEAHRSDEGALLRPVPAPLAPTTAFRFQTDASGLIRWCDHPVRSTLVGRALAESGSDGAVRGAFARRSPIRDARLTVPGDSEAAGDWRISARAAFDRASGRFTGYRGTARRPRRDEAPQLAVAAEPTGDSLRQLVHELRTPTNAISGFAEMIEHQLLGPVPDVYRQQAAAIREQTGGLLDAIDDLDTAARIATRRLDLYPEAVPLVPLLQRVMADLQPLADLRGAFLTFDLAEGLAVRGDARALQRLFARLLTALVATATPGEVLTGEVEQEGELLRLDITRPQAFAAPDGGLFDGDAEAEQIAAGEPLLGVGFAFRLARGLAGELGGTIMVNAERLTLRLPAAVVGIMGQASG